MSLEQCISSLDTAEDYSQTSSSGIGQLSLLSGMDMPAKSSENAQPMDGSPACECGRGMSDCLIHPSTPEKWTAFMRDSLARTLALLESRQAYLREPDQVFTEKSCASLAWYDPSNFSWKTYQQSLVTGWEPYSETWPRWGMSRNGVAYAHLMSAQTISATDGGYWPTPVKSDGLFPFAMKTMVKKERGEKRKSGATIGTALKWDRRALPWVNGGRINPTLTEWMMGMPAGWSALREWEMPKFRSKQQPPGSCSVEAEALEQQ